MAAGDSITSIMNLALMHLGEDPIVSPDDAVKSAILLKQCYEAVRRRVLRGFPYTSAKQSISLPLSTYVPLTSYDYAYSLPSDCLRFWDLPDNDGAKWEVGQDAKAGNLLLTNEGPPLAGVYIRDLQDPTRMDSQLVDVLALELAQQVCMSLTQSMSKLQAVGALLTDRKPDAQLTASDEESTREWDEDIWLRARQ